MRIISYCWFVFLLLASGFSAADAADYPGRKMPNYREVPHIEMEKLYEAGQKGAVVIVDVRSKLEYDTIHIKGAVHLPLGSGFFENAVKSLAGKHPGKMLAFYCNGTTCLKSYEAQLRAQNAGVDGTYAFDLGIPGWAEIFPEETVLLGHLLTESKVKWIPKWEFKKRCVPWPQFKKMAARKNTKVIDARDNIQKGVLSEQALAVLTPEEKETLKQFSQKNRQMIADLTHSSKIISLPFDKMIPNIIQRKALQDRTLLIFDQVGKQIRWLMYQLEANGYTDYYFLDGGALEVVGIQAYRKK